jgi:hypothetical protein
LRPFQRKLAFWDQALAIMEATDIRAHQKEEIMWRTGTSKEAMQPETAWKRMKLIEKEVEKVAAKVLPICGPGKNHEDVVAEYIQEQFETVSGQKGKPHPRNWEHAHNNVIMLYQMYYRGGQIDPNFPPPTSPKEIVVPAEKPKSGSQPYYLAMSDGDDNKHDVNDADLAAIVGSDGGDNRRLVLKEVREHLDILKEFEGVISADELNKRKRDLFLALPAAPPPKRSTGGLFTPTKK